MKPFPNLKMTKISDAEVTWGDYGASAPQGPGDFSYRTPAVWRVTGPTGTAYLVQGKPRGWMQTPSWYYYAEGDKSVQKGGFNSRIDTLEHINQREQAMLAQPSKIGVIHA